MVEDWRPGNGSSDVQNLALTVLLLPSSLKSGLALHWQRVHALRVFMRQLKEGREGLKRF